MALEPARSAKLAANWMLGEIGRWMNVAGREIGDLPATRRRLAELIRMVEDGKVTAAVAKEVFEKMAASGDSAAAIVAVFGAGRRSAATTS